MEEVIDLAMGEIEAKSKKALYQTDFLAWADDVLGRRYYQKMAEIASEVSDPRATKTRTAVKSANGCGKSFLLSDLGTWWVTVFPPEESLAIFSANGRQQIETVVFRYLKDNYGYMKSHDYAPVGWIGEQLEWKYAKPDGSGNEMLAFGKRPSDQDIVSSFQGTRKRRTFIGFDEMGGLPTDLFTAAEAIITGDPLTSRFFGIGNPDHRGTEFHRMFTNPDVGVDWNLHTISAYDLPTLTGEIVYPDPEKQKRMLTSGMTTRAWVEHKERVWKVGGKWDARGLAKVLGEFPGESDFSFFPQGALDKARDVEIDNPGAPVILGVDVAAMGEDESVVYVNRGGKVRLFDKTVHYKDSEGNHTTTGVWSKEDEVQTARRIHAIAQHLGAEEVRIDAAGLGGGIFRMLERLDEFNDKCYILVAIIGSNSSNDRDQWHNVRAENHDSLRRQMIDGKIDLDPEDKDVFRELEIITYELDKRRAIQITPKKEMKTELGGSPDRVDALIYATTDVSALVDGPQPGSILEIDTDIYDEDSSFYSYSW